MQAGETIAFLDEQGGGKVVAVYPEQQAADIEIEDGFVLRVPLNKCVVIQDHKDDPYTIRHRTENRTAVPESVRKAESMRQKEQNAQAKAQKEKQIEEKRMQENLAALIGKYKKN